MKLKTTVLLALLFALWLAVAPARAGGWAVVTLEDWPEVVRAGETFSISFSIRQHGQELAGGYEPIVRAFNPAAGPRLEFTANETKRTGFYAADLTLPEAGEWNWSISYYGGADGAQTMPVLTVAEPGPAADGRSTPVTAGPAIQAGYLIAALGTLVLFAGAGFYAVTRSRTAVVASTAGLLILAGGLLAVPAAQAAGDRLPQDAPAAAAETLPLEAQGRILFQAKGCIVCHNHVELRQGFTGITTNIGPEMTWGTKRPVEFLETWLKDPAAIKPDTVMPNLELSEAEIEALAAFLMSELDG